MSIEKKNEQSQSPEAKDLKHFLTQQLQSLFVAELEKSTLTKETQHEVSELLDQEYFSSDSLIAILSNEVTEAMEQYK